MRRRWSAGRLEDEVVSLRGALREPLCDLLSADRVKQPQKGLFGALSILPAGSNVAEDTQVPDGQGTGNATRLTRAQVTVTAPPGAAGSGGEFRENLLMHAIGPNVSGVIGSAIVAGYFLSVVR